MEFTFQKIVLIIAIILLIITLVVIGYSLTKAKAESQWPPIVGDCPDYWIDVSGNGSACVNVQSLGKCNIPTAGAQNPKNFSVGAYNGSNSMCAKYTWSKNCDVTWDGITSGVANPCTKDKK